LRLSSARAAASGLPLTAAETTLLVEALLHEVSSRNAASANKKPRFTVGLAGKFISINVIPTVSRYT